MGIEGRGLHSPSSSARTENYHTFMTVARPNVRAQLVRSLDQPGKGGTFWILIRNDVHEKPTLAIRRPGSRDPVWSEYFHLSVGGIRVLGGRYSMAAFLSGMDVPSDHCAEFERQSMGIFHWNFRGRVLGLYQYLRDYLLLQWTSTACAVVSHWAFGQAGSLDLSTCMVLQFTGDNRLLVGVCSLLNQKTKGRCSACAFLCAHNGLLRPSHGAVPASVSRGFPATIASALAMGNLIGTKRLGI